MEKNKYYELLIGICTASAIIGILLGYFVIAPIGTAGTSGDEYVEFNRATAAVEYFEEQAAETEIEYSNEQNAEVNYLVSSSGGFLVVYNANEEPEFTLIPVNALPAEEQERLAAGIRVYTEEALIRILEDYGS